MSFIQWTRANAVGVQLVDEQHQHLFALLNRLHESVVRGKEQEELRAVLDELIDYTVYHFQTEEDLFTEHGFPDAEEHKRIHIELTRTVLDLQDTLRAGSAVLSFELLDFLNGWLMDHTLGLDQRIGEHLNSRGVY